MKTELVGMEEVRKEFAHRLALANPQPDPKNPDADLPEPVHTAVTQRGRLSGFVVGPEWYRKAREALGDSTDL